MGVNSVLEDVTREETSTVSTQLFTPPTSGTNPNPTGETSSDLFVVKLQALDNFFMNALENKREGRGDLFFTVVHEFQRAQVITEADIDRVYTWLLVFTKRVSHINSDCEALVVRVLDIDWYKQSEDFVKVFYKFILHLVSVHPIYVGHFIKMATTHFTDANKNDNSTPQTLRLVHALLKEVLLHVPTSSTTLCNGLISKLPNKWAKAEAHVSYCENLLLVTRYIPILRDQLLTALVQKFLELDTEVQVEIDELKQLVENHTEEGMFDLEIDEPSDSEGEEEDADNDLLNPFAIQTKKHTSIKEINKLVEKLDSVLVPLFNYLSSFDYNSEQGFSLFHHMLQVFSKYTLRTFKSRHVQFIMFYLCSLNSRFTDAFLGSLFDILDSPSTPRITRISAAAYISSFTSRAKWLRADEVRRVGSLLVSWLVNYVKGVPTGENRLDVKRHALFYAMTQAILYLFCFRWQSFRHLSPQGTQWDPSITPLRHLLHSSLRPMKVCNKRLVEQFALLCQNLDFMYCYSIIEEDSKFSLSFGEMEQNNLEIFCPFDPYQLEGTSHYFSNTYISWQEACESPETASSSKPIITPSPSLQKNSQPYRPDSDAESSDIEIEIRSPMVGMSLSPITGFLPPK